MHTHVQPALEHLLSLDLSYIETLDMEELATRGGGRGGLLRGLKRLVCMCKGCESSVCMGCEISLCLCVCVYVCVCLCVCLRGARISGRC